SVDQVFSGLSFCATRIWKFGALCVVGDTRTPSVKVSPDMKARSTTNNATTMPVNEKKDFMAVNAQMTSPRDAPDRSRLSILFDLRKVGLAVLGSRLGM